MSDDPISRRGAINALNASIIFGRCNEKTVTFKALKKYAEGVRERIEALPPVDAVPVTHGRCKMNENGTYSCSECQSWILSGQKHYANFCLYCGAKMDEEENWE